MSLILHASSLSLLGVGDLLYKMSNVVLKLNGTGLN